MTYHGFADGLDATTTFLADNRHKMSPGNISAARAALNVEACQSTFDVRVDDRSLPLESAFSDPSSSGRSLKSLGQELVCGMLGFARAAKANRHDHEGFRRVVGQLPPGLFGPLTIPDSLIDAATYAAL